MSQYKEFKLIQNENISNMNGRFQKIINNLKMLGKIISEEDQIKKILRSLTVDWQPLVTAISQPKNLKELKMKELIGTLLTHELILNKTNKDPKGKKTLVLKANEETESSEEEEEDETTVLSKAFAKIMRKRENEHRKIPSTCFKCKKSGHI